MFNNSFTVPGFDEDRHSEADAARPVLTDEERAEMAAYDRWVAQLAAQQAPLDGCEDEAPFPGSGPYADEGNLAAEVYAMARCADDEARANCAACDAPLTGIDGLALVMCACGAWNNIKASRVPHLRLVAAG